MPNFGPITPSRAKPWTLVPAARFLYEQGLTQSQVFEAIYGVDLPLEAKLFLREFVSSEADDQPLEASWGTLPWELMIPLDAGGPRFVLPSHESEREVLAYSQAPHVLLLGITGYNEVAHGGSLFGYDLDEVRAGRTTVVGLECVRAMPKADAMFTVFGSSLVSVFCELIINYRSCMESWMSAGTGPYTQYDLDRVNRHLCSIETLREEVDAICGDTDRDQGAR